jgi:hypothetical protein
MKRGVRWLHRMGVQNLARERRFCVPLRGPFQICATVLLHTGFQHLTNLKTRKTCISPPPDAANRIAQDA